MLNKFKKFIFRKLIKSKLLAGSFKNQQDVFTEIYKKGYWQNEQSVSGSGSTEEYTVVVRRELPKLVQELGVMSIYDAPCGDFAWFKLIKWLKPINYVGADIVQGIIDTNSQLYKGDRVEFFQTDIVASPPPHTLIKLDKKSLWLCRDCLFHLPLEDGVRVLKHFSESNFDYLLTSTHIGVEANTQINAGDFRLINLTLPPYNLPEPSVKIADYVEGYPERYLALWSREQVKKALML